MYEGKGRRAMIKNRTISKASCLSCGSSRGDVVGYVGGSAVRRCCDCGYRWEPEMRILRYSTSTPRSSEVARGGE